MSDILIVELTENRKSIAAANVYSGDAGTWLKGVTPEDFLATSEDKTVVLLVDGRLAAMHQINVPDIDDIKLLKILPGLMDEKISTSGQQNQLALFGDYNPSKKSRAVCVIEKETLTEVLSSAALLGIKPDIVTPDFVLLEAPATGARVAILHDRYVVRTEKGDGFTSEKNVAEAIVGDLAKAETIELSDWYKEIGRKIIGSCNFLHGDFAQNTNWIAGLIWWKRAVYLAFSAVVIYSVLHYYKAVQNYQSTENLYVQTESLFRTALPNEPRIVNMEAQLRRALVAQQQTGGGEFFSLFAVAAQAVQTDPTASIETVRYDASDSELLLTVSFQSYAEIATFNEIIAGAGLQVTEGSSRQEGGRVFADLRVRAG